MWEHGRTASPSVDRIREEIKRIGDEVERIRRAVIEGQGNNKGDPKEPPTNPTNAGIKHEEEK